MISTTRLTTFGWLGDDGASPKPWIFAHGWWPIYYRDPNLASHHVFKMAAQPGPFKVRPRPVFRVH